MAENTVVSRTGERLTWRPLDQRRIIIPDLRGRGISQLGAFGSCGDRTAPDYVPWRQERLYPVLEEYGIERGQVFDPDLTTEWTPHDAQIEGIHLACDKVLVVGVTNHTLGYISLMEVGFAVFGGLRGQDVAISVQLDDETPAEAHVPRQLAKMILAETGRQYPFFTMVETLDQLAHVGAHCFAERIRFQGSEAHKKVEFHLPPLRTDLVPSIYLSGTSGSTRPSWMTKMTALLEANDMPVDDSYRSNWDVNVEGEAEVSKKLDTAVQLVAITGETPSLGALSELGPRALHAYLAGQSFGVYIEPHDSAPHSVTNRSRMLALEHMRHLRGDFPDLPIYVADSLENLARWGLGQYLMQAQRLRG